MAYANGRYPLHLFIHRGDNIYLTPSLNARWNEAVRLALEKYGVRLYITGDVDGLGGWNGYRPYAAQVAYKNHYGRFAAAPGWSSHGGQYGGREVFAADVANWQHLAPGNKTLAWSRFVAIMRIVGLITNFVTPEELWHIGDVNPAWTVPTFGRITINPQTTNRPTEPEEEDEPMKYGLLHTTRPDGKMLRRALYAPGTAYFVYWDGNDSALANSLARQFDTGNSLEVSYGVFEAFQKAAAAAGGAS